MKTGPHLMPVVFTYLEVVLVNQFPLDQNLRPLEKAEHSVPDLKTCPSFEELTNTFWSIKLTDLEVRPHLSWPYKENPQRPKIIVSKEGVLSTVLSSLSFVFHKTNNL